jgi:hypothetical protein
MAAIPLAAGISRAQQGPITTFPAPDASNNSPRYGIDSRADDPATRLANAKRIKELNTLRQKQIATDAAKLLLLATELKANVENGDDVTSPAQLMRKAEQIEKLAHTVRARMTDAVGVDRLTP